MSKKLWNIGMKCPDLEAELEFNRKMGHEVVIEKEPVTIGDKEQFQALVRIGDKYMVLAEEWGMEQFLPQEFAYGATHMSHAVDDFDSAVQRALAAGATLLHGPDEMDAQYGRRIVACFRSPGGMVFCLFQVLEHRVPEV